MGKNMRNEGKKEKKGLLELEREMRRKEDLGVLYGGGVDGSRGVPLSARHGRSYRSLSSV